MTKKKEIGINKAFLKNNHNLTSTTDNNKSEEEKNDKLLLESMNYNIKTEEPNENNKNPHLKKLTVILDLDGTLMYTHQKNEFYNNDIQSYNDSNNDIVVVMRPEVKHFILKLQKFADLVIFTAGTQSYADPLIDLLDPTHTIFKHR